MKFKMRDGSVYDIGAKHLYFEADGNRYDIFFRDTVLRGVHNVRVDINNKKKNIKILGAYPPLREVLLYTLIMLAPKKLKAFFTKLWLKYSRDY